ncbi:DMT family transporter [Pinisolibacter sp.]|mgnify:CR=1 FL=1|uniref:DMT family transporter n=1 Tax=Pinisolibacter sp. TaxID=2172024 RepID=UPI002FDDF0BB
MDDRRAGLIDGLIGVAFFSGSLVATRFAVTDFDPFFSTWARAVGAAFLASAALLVAPRPWPTGREFVALAVVSATVVIGFPVGSALALREITAARATLFIGLLPLFTASFAILRGIARPPHPAFWLFAAAGSAVVALYALGGTLGGTWRGDGFILGAVVSAGLGYAEGARLTARFGGWRVISWAVVLALPLTLPLMLHDWPDWSRVGWPAIGGLAYTAAFSQWIGFLFWYRGLERGGVAAVGQLQLLQPFLGLILAAVLLGDTIDPRLALSTVLVVLCIFGARRFATPARRPVIAEAIRDSAP